MQKATQGSLVGGQDESHTQIWLWRPSGHFFWGWLVAFPNHSPKLSPLLGLHADPSQGRRNQVVPRPIGHWAVSLLVGNLWETQTPWKLPNMAYFGCLWFVFLGKEQVVREQIVTTWQGFSGHRGILGKVRSAERQGFRGEPGTQGDVRAAGDVGYVKHLWEV